MSAEVNIPRLDLNDYIHGNPEEKKKFSDDLGKAYHETGFVNIANHGMTKQLMDKLYEEVKKFFSLPDELKKKYEIEGLAGQRGYTGKGKEKAKDSTTPDLKEFWQSGQVVTDNDPVKDEYPENIRVEELPEFNTVTREVYRRLVTDNDPVKDEYPENIRVEELPEFNTVTREVYRRLEDAGKHLLHAIAVYLGLPENYFDDKVHNGNSILRAIHYFPINDPESLAADAVRAGAHEDINLITLLIGASADGLEVLTRDGKWFPVKANDEDIVVNVGDMLQRLTNNKLKSTTHRVVNPPPELMKNSRYSVPFFLHPKSNMDLSCLGSCIDAGNPKAYENSTAGEYLDERLREIGLKK